MKTLFIAALLLLCLSAMAQNQPTPNEQPRHAFDPVDKSITTTGYLVNQQFSLVEPRHFQGLLPLAQRLQAFAPAGSAAGAILYGKFQERQVRFVPWH